MRMKKSIVRSYLGVITMSSAAQSTDPMKTLDHFNPAIENLRAQLRQGEDEKWVRMALKSLISDPENRIGAFKGQVFPFRDDELVKLFSYTYAQLWNDDPSNDEYPLVTVDIESMSDEDWEIEKSIQETLMGT